MDIPIFGKIGASALAGGLAQTFIQKYTAQQGLMGAGVDVTAQFGFLHQDDLIYLGIGIALMLFGGKVASWLRWFGVGWVLSVILKEVHEYAFGYGL